MASEESQEMTDFMAVRTLNVTYKADGSSELCVASYRTPDKSPEDAAEFVSKEYGIEPSNIHRLTPERARRNGTAAFLSTRWNSSWEPIGGNPNYN